jgi:hypothetical protein
MALAWHWHCTTTSICCLRCLYTAVPLEVCAYVRVSMLDHLRRDFCTSPFILCQFLLQPYPARSHACHRIATRCMRLLLFRCLVQIP